LAEEEKTMKLIFQTKDETRNKKRVIEEERKGNYRKRIFNVF